MNIKMIRRFLGYAFFLLLTTASSHAQLSSGGFPQPELLEGTCLRADLDERVDMPPFSMDSLMGDTTLSHIGGFRFAYGFKTHLTPQNSGRTTFLRNGSKVWRLHIRSKEALSISLIFDQFKLSDGDQLFLYSPDRSHILGAFTSKNNHPSGVFATSIIEDDEVVVELTSLPHSTSEISIGEVNHAFRSIQALPGMGYASECNVDVSCDPDVPDSSRRSVALMVIDGKTLCSGSLINNTSLDKTPYFLSAAHCMESNKGTAATSLDEANTLAATCVFYFNYESPHCLPYVQGTLEMSLSGAEAVTFNRNTDLLLLRLNEMPPVDYNCYLSGWNITNDIEVPVYSIHHSMGETKKFSLSNEMPTAGTFYCCDDFTFTANNHWIVNSWEKGLTESGSSGGPLFDHQGHIIGALTGGDDYEGCNTSNIADAFYRLNHVWNSRLSSYALSSQLDPSNSGTKLLEGLEPYDFPCDRLSNFTSSDNLLYSEEDNYVAGNNQLGYTQYAERFTEGGQVLGVFFLPEFAIYSDLDSVWIKVYEGSDYPEHELYKQRVRISDTQYNYRSKIFTSATTVDLASRDNYLHFDSPVTVHDPFFIVLEVPEAPNYPFAIYASEEKSDSLNTAYFKDGETWKPFTQHPLVQKPTSLLINPQTLLFSRTYSEPVRSDKPMAIVSPNPSDGEFSIQFVEMPTLLELYSVDGMKKDQMIVRELTSTINISSYNAGLYILKISYNTHTEYVKLIKR